MSHCVTLRVLPPLRPDHCCLAPPSDVRLQLTARRPSSLSGYHGQVSCLSGTAREGTSSSSNARGSFQVHSPWRPESSRLTCSLRAPSHILKDKTFAQSSRSFSAIGHAILSQMLQGHRALVQCWLVVFGVNSDNIKPTPQLNSSVEHNILSSNSFHGVGSLRYAASLELQQSSSLSSTQTNFNFSSHK